MSVDFRNIYRQSCALDGYRRNKPNSSNMSGPMKIHESSQTTVSSICDIFAAPPTNGSVISGEFVEMPSVYDANDGILHFKLSAGETRYMVPNETYLEIEAKVVKTDGSTIGDDKVYLAGGGIHSLFESVSVTLDGQDVSYASDYPYSSMLETLISHPMETKKGHLIASGWSEDSIEGRAMDHAKVIRADTTARTAFIADSRVFQLSDRLHIPLFHQDKLIPGDIQLDVKLKRSSPQFVLTRHGDNADGTYKIKIVKAKMMVRVCELQPAILRAHQLTLAAGNSYKYEMDRIKIHSSTVSAGVLDYRNVVQVSGNSPSKVIVLFVDNEGKQGSYARNPFIFENANVSSYSLTVNGRPVGPRTECDFPLKQVDRAYRSLNACSETLFGSTSNGITPDRFIEGRTLFCFNLQPELSDSEGVPLIHNKALEINFIFRTALTRALTVMVYMQMPELLEIDQNHSIRTINSII